MICRNKVRTTQGQDNFRRVIISQEFKCKNDNSQVVIWQRTKPEYLAQRWANHLANVIATNHITIGFFISPSNASIFLRDTSRSFLSLFEHINRRGSLGALSKSRDDNTKSTLVCHARAAFCKSKSDVRCASRGPAPTATRASPHNGPLWSLSSRACTNRKWKIGRARSRRRDIQIPYKRECTRILWESSANWTCPGYARCSNNQACDYGGAVSSTVMVTTINVYFFLFLSAGRKAFKGSVLLPLSWGFRFSFNLSEV